MVLMPLLVCWHGQLRSTPATVRLGTEGAYPPFAVIDQNGRLGGFDVDIGNALCAAAKLDCEWVIQDWDGLIPGLLAEKYDAILASMAITEERREVVDFTDRYYDAVAAVIGSDDTEFKGTVKETVAGKIVGAQSATIHENYARENFADVAEIRTYDQVEQAHLDLTAGRIDFFIEGFFAVSEGFLRTDQGDGFSQSSATRSPTGAGLVTVPASPCGRAMTHSARAFNAAIRQIRDEGTYQRINEKYFDFDIYGEDG